MFSGGEWMQQIAKPELLEASLTRAAEALGDITPHVFARYYDAFPEARERFEDLSLHRPEQLQGEMIEQALYCLMQWFFSPDEIRIVMVGTVPHHFETLEITPRSFSGLMDTICDVIVETIPADRRDELAVWEELREAMRGLFAEGCQYLMKPVTCPHAAAAVA